MSAVFLVKIVLLVVLAGVAIYNYISFVDGSDD